MARVTTGRVLQPGTRLGKYTLQSLIARGGMAELYLARATGVRGFEKLVALKLVLPHLADDASFLEMFLDEARLASKLDHPNIAQVLDLGEADGEHFMAMEYVHGKNVREVLTRAQGRTVIPLDAALTVVLEACRGLHYAHELTDDHGRPLGIVHRDVSPSNLLVRYDGVVKLVDFGIAKAANRSQHTRTGVLKGKSGYMSPEQCRGLPVDRRSDVFGLGILLYELTTCQRLFYGDNDFAVLNRIIDAEFERPSEVVDGYPPELENIVLQALDPRVDNRFSSAWQMQDALESFAQSAGLRPAPVRLAKLMSELFGDVPAPAVTETHRLPGTSRTRASWRRRRRSRWAALGLGVAGSCLAIAGYLAGTASSSESVDRSSATPPAAPAQPETKDPVPVPARVEVAAPSPAVVPVPVPAAGSAVIPQASTDERAVRRRATKKKRPHRSRRSDGADKPKPGPGRTPDSMMPRE